MKRNEVIVKIEIPIGSKIKYEYDRKTSQIQVDRILVGDFNYPANYGFIPETLDYDGDELDVLVYSEHAFMPGTSLKARIVGAMKMLDDGETDTKLLAVHADDKSLDEIKQLSDLPKPWLDKVHFFFANYKNYKRLGITKVSGFENLEFALNEIQECQELMTKYGKLSKSEFLEKMRILHPSKYSE